MSKQTSKDDLIQKFERARESYPSLVDALLKARDNPNPVSQLQGLW